MKSIRARASLSSLSSASALVLLVAGSGVYACSSDAPTPGGSSGSSSGGTDAAIDRNVVPSEGGSDASDGGSMLPLGNLPTIDEPDVPCVTTAGIKTVLFPKAATSLGGPAVTLLQALGTRRFAAGLSTQGFITFDAVGTTPQLFNVTLGTTETAFSSEGTTIGAAVISPGKVEYQRYNDQGAAAGAVVSLASGIAAGPPRSWLASGGGGSLVVWPSGDTLFAAVVTAAGAAAGPAFTLATNATKPRVAITYSGDKYVVAYSYTTTGGTASAARLAFVGAAGVVGTPVDIAAASALEPVAITPTASGFLLVIDTGGDDHVYTVPLSAAGTVSGPAHRLLGGDLPFAIASHGNDAALVVLTNDVKIGNAEGPRAPQFRPLDVTGKPSGPWVCLDGRIAAGLYPDMSILAEASGGYSVVYKSPADATVLVRVDKLGTRAP